MAPPATNKKYNELTEKQKRAVLGALLGARVGGDLPHGTMAKIARNLRVSRFAVGRLSPGSERRYSFPRRLQQQRPQAASFDLQQRGCYAADQGDSPLEKDNSEECSQGVGHPKEHSSKNHKGRWRWPLFQAQQIEGPAH